MTDKELLELAAKAAGKWPSPEPFEHVLDRWNPLTNDGDAFRLAVKLGLSIHIGTYKVACEWIPQDEGASIVKRENLGADEYAATRRAIVRTAAEIGKKEGE